jgi:hypothetical protein
VGKLGKLLPSLLLLAAVFWLYAPALGFSLMGDDYQWVQHAHRATHQLHLLLADLDSFYRPANTWTLVADRLLWGARDGGFHGSSLLWQWLAALALALAAMRLGLGRVGAWTVAALWALSPFAEESAVSVAIRFENLLLASWLLLILWWPEGEDSAKGVRFWLPVLLAAFSKETWVVTPALVWALAFTVQRKSAAASLRAALPAALAAAGYTALYFLLFPSDKSYFRYELAVLRKVPVMLAGFLHLEIPVPLEFPLTFRGVLATAVVACLVFLALRFRDPLGTVGAFLLLFAPLPTLFVPYLPQRYMALPYAGFLLLAAALLRRLWQALPTRVRPWAGVAGLGGLGLLLAAHASVVRADLRDWARVSAAHARLVDQARQALPFFPLDRPVLVVRADGSNVLRDIALSVEGWPKLFYPRRSDPGGLIDAAALFEWVLQQELLGVRSIPDHQQRLRGKVGAVLVYQATGFRLLQAQEPDLGAASLAWQSRGFPVRAVEAYRLPLVTF